MYVGPLELIMPYVCLKNKDYWSGYLCFNKFNLCWQDYIGVGFYGKVFWKWVTVKKKKLKNENLYYCQC